MPKQLTSAEAEQLKHLEVLRETYRRNIAHYEQAAAKHGGEDNLPIYQMNDLRSNRESLAKVEADLAKLTGEPVLTTPAPEPGSAIHPPKKREITQEQRRALAKLLLNCQTIKNAGSRNTIVNMLEDISYSIIRDGSPLIDVTNIVSGCLDYENGGETLLATVRSFEGNSLPMQKVDAFWQSL